MPVEVNHSPPPLHRPGDVTARPKGILKNPSFSGPSGQGGPGFQPHSPTKSGGTPTLPPSASLDPHEAKDLTIQNTLQNAGARRSSSAARRTSTSRRHSSTAGVSLQSQEESDKMRLKWDEANLYLAEQESGGRMKITEPKTPFQYGDDVMEEEEEEDVGIDARFVNVDEVEMAKGRSSKKSRESDIPGLELGEPEDEGTAAGAENDRIVRSNSLSREGSKDKHVSVSAGGQEAAPGAVGFANQEDEEKHRQFEEQRKKHYEMRSVKDLLGHPESMDMEEEEEDRAPKQSGLPSRRLNGGS